MTRMTSVSVSVYGLHVSSACCIHTYIATCASVCVNKCVLVCCGWCWLPEADYHPHPSVLFLPVSPPVWKLCGHPLDCLTAEACRTLLSSYPSVLLIFFPLCRVSSFHHFSVERWRERECKRERRGKRGGRAEIWELVEEGGWRVGGAEQRWGFWGFGCKRLGGHRAWTMDEQKGERETLLKCRDFLSLSFSHSLRVSLFSWERPPLRLPPPPPSLLSPPPSCSEAPLVHTLHSPSPSSSTPPPPLPLAPSACLPSLPPGGLGQCWRRSRDLQEICLSEKQLVRLSTANVCMLGLPPPPLPSSGARARPWHCWCSLPLFILFTFHPQAIILLFLRWLCPL